MLNVTDTLVLGNNQPASGYRIKVVPYNQGAVFGSIVVSLAPVYHNVATNGTFSFVLVSGSPLMIYEIFFVPPNAPDPSAPALLVSAAPATGTFTLSELSTDFKISLGRVDEVAGSFVTLGGL